MAVVVIAEVDPAVVPLVGQPLDDRDATNANDDSIATTAITPTIDLLVDETEYFG